MWVMTSVENVGLLSNVPNRIEPLNSPTRAPTSTPSQGVVRRRKKPARLVSEMVVWELRFVRTAAGVIGKSVQCGSERSGVCCKTTGPVGSTQDNESAPAF